MRLVRSPSRQKSADSFTDDISANGVRLVKQVLREKLSMTSVERLSATWASCTAVISNQIPGAFVETGVWRGGHAVVASQAFRELGASRELWLFDTFAGMTKPTGVDVRFHDRFPAIRRWEAEKQSGDILWSRASLPDVMANLDRFGSLNQDCHFVEGPLEETLITHAPQELPQKIAVLRLDTDWYESTKIALEFFWPRLSPGGIIIIDDYGWWLGSRKATEEYFAEIGLRPLLIPSDGGQRIGVKHTGSRP